MIKILQVPYDKLKMFSVAMLDNLTSTAYTFGKNTERYWLIKNNTLLADNGDHELHSLNALMHLVRERMYDSIMIIK